MSVSNHISPVSGLVGAAACEITLPTNELTDVEAFVKSVILFQSNSKKYQVNTPHSQVRGGVN